MKVHVIGDVVAKGQGIGRSKAYGHVVFAKNNEEALTRMNEGDILVTHATEKEMMPAIEKLLPLLQKKAV